MPELDNQQPAENTPAAPAESTQDATPASEATNQPVDAPEGQSQPVSTSPEEAPVDAPRRPSRAERRIQQLNSQVKQVGQVSQPAPAAPQSPQFDIRTYADQDGNIDENAVNQNYSQNVVQTADAIASLRVNQQLAQRDAVHYFEQDSAAIPTKYEELNPDHDSFTPELDEAIAQEFQDRAFRVVGYDRQGQPITQLDPSVRLADITERHVKAARAYAQRVSSQQNRRVADAADTAAVPPTGDKPSEVPFESLTRNQMKERLGYHKR